MTDYKVGRVYKITNNVDDLIYVGSTFKSLSRRFYEHVVIEKDGLVGNQYIKKYGDCNCAIELIREYKVADKRGLIVWESVWIDKLKPVNSKMPINILCGRCCHFRIKSYCKECNGGSICNHSRRRSNCKECKGGSICEHSRLKHICKECGGSQICEHSKVRSGCKECKGGSICEHSKEQRACKDCGVCCLKCRKNYSLSSIKRHKCKPI